jgi:dihydroorotase-like cyclic amidohydrolase
MVIDRGVIAGTPNITSSDITVDGQHGTLLPGLIDSHVYLRTLAELKLKLQRWGE